MLPRSFASIARYCLHCFSLRLAFICSYLSSLESVSMPPSFALFSLMLQVVFGRALSSNWQLQVKVFGYMLIIAALAILSTSYLTHSWPFGSLGARFPH